MDSKPLILHSYRRCPFAMRVRIVLHEKEIPFQVKEEDLKNKSPELLRLHPEGRVPLLLHGTHVIYESSVITEYLEDAFPKPSLLPKDPALRAEARLWTYWCNTTFKPDVDHFKYGTSRFPEKECIGINEKIVEHLQKLETQLKISEWLVGPTFSLADIHVFPFARQLAHSKPAPEYLSQYSALQKWMTTIEARTSFAKTMEKL